MKTRILIVIVIIFAAGSAAVGYLLWKQSNEITDTQTRLTGLESRISALTDNIDTACGSIASANPAASLVSRYGPVLVRVDAASSRFQASGSGFIVHNRGYIVTNHHVVKNAASIKITLEDGRQSAATILSGDQNLDLALLKLDSSLANLSVAALGTANDIIIGEDVVAAGFPLGADLPGPVSFTRGIVSAVRSINGGWFIQTDVIINPGNSGGCLINFNGKVIGVTTASVIPHNVDPGNIGLAIPVDVVRSFLQSNLKEQLYPY